MLAHLLAVGLKHKLAAAALILSVGGGGVAAAAAISSPPPHPTLLQAAGEGTPVGLGASSPAATSPLASPAGPTAAQPGGAASPPTSPAGTATPATAASSPASPAKTPATPKTPAPGTSGATAGAPLSMLPALPTLAAPSPSPTVSCPTNQRLTDAEIKWLLKEVSKTAAADPSVSAGAAEISARLQPLLGQNLCASQAQPVVTNLCSDSAALKAIDAMTGQLPFYVKPFVGNPCTDNLASLLPTLSSFTSMLG